MPSLVVVLRIVSLLVFVAPISLIAGRRRGEPNGDGPHAAGPRAPLVANIASFGLFYLALAVTSGRTAVPHALPLAAVGALLAMVGATIVQRSRAELGSAWSLVPRADHGAGLVTTGPYRLVRHPIYLGFSLLALGQALAFASWPALGIVVLATVPTFAWRARAEEALLHETFAERFAEYRARTRMIIPGVL